MVKSSEFKIFTDGAARGNPGPAGAGWIVFNSAHAVISEGKKYLGEATNNQAEYQALLLALEEAKKNGATTVSVFCDSELMVKQLRGEYKVKNEGLKTLFQKAVVALGAFGSYTMTHVVREKNKGADRLANEAIDDYFG